MPVDRSIEIRRLLAVLTGCIDEQDPRLTAL